MYITSRTFNYSLETKKKRLEENGAEISIDVVFPLANNITETDSYCAYCDDAIEYYDDESDEYVVEVEKVFNTTAGTHCSLSCAIEHMDDDDYECDLCNTPAAGLLISIDPISSLSVTGFGITKLCKEHLSMIPIFTISKKDRKFFNAIRPKVRVEIDDLIDYSVEYLEESVLEEGVYPAIGILVPDDVTLYLNKHKLSDIPYLFYEILQLDDNYFFAKMAKTDDDKEIATIYYNIATDKQRLVNGNFDKQMMFRTYSLSRGNIGELLKEYGHSDDFINFMKRVVNRASNGMTTPLKALFDNFIEWASTRQEKLATISVIE